MRAEVELGLLVIFSLIFVCGIFILETAFAGLITIFFGIEIGSLIAFAIAGLNLMIFSAIVLYQLTKEKTTKRNR